MINFTKQLDILNEKYNKMTEEFDDLLNEKEKCLTQI